MLNQVVSQKQMVKHLQQEVARLEAVLRTPEPKSCSEALLMQKDLKIQEVYLRIEVILVTLELYVVVRNY